MKNDELKKFRIFWWVVLSVLAAMALLVFYFYEPRAAEASEAGLWTGSSPAGYAAWIFGGLGTVFSIVGARMGRSVFMPGWHMAERMAERARMRGRKKIPNPAMGVYALAMGLVECTGLLGVVLYVRTGSFNAYILLTGMALLGWLVARPDATAEGNADEPAAG